MQVSLSSNSCACCFLHYGLGALLLAFLQKHRHFNSSSTQMLVQKQNQARPSLTHLFFLPRYFNWQMLYQKFHKFRTNNIERELLINSFPWTEGLKGSTNKQLAQQSRMTGWDRGGKQMRQHQPGSAPSSFAIPLGVLESQPNTYKKGCGTTTAHRAPL